ncbi:MAG: hypothetical protein WD696_11525 [Bryobacteraceae bacterium]
MATAQNIAALFDHGWWDELERILRDAVQKDPADTKSVFRLANLLGLRGQYEEALRWFDLCADQGWPGPLSLNNKGVVLAWMGEARAALRCLQGAKNSPEDVRTSRCAPALYNLGIIYDRLVEDGGRLPWVVIEAQETQLSGGANEIARGHFVEANSAAWEASHVLDRPLYLWKDDIPSRFGFETSRNLGDIQTAHDLFRDALNFLDEGK